MHESLHSSAPSWCYCCLMPTTLRICVTVFRNKNTVTYWVTWTPQLICIIYVSLNAFSCILLLDNNIHFDAKSVFLNLQTAWLQTVAGPPQSPCYPGLLRWAWAHKSESQLRLYLPAWAQLRRSVMTTSRPYPWTHTGRVSCSKTLLFLHEKTGGDAK